MSKQICPKCGSVAFYDPYFGAWVCTRSDCDFFERKHPTHRERLHAMDNGEFSEWIETIADCNRCKLSCPDKKGYPVSPASCALHWKEWLGLEVENEQV